jgi:hypothetical protein
MAGWAGCSSNIDETGTGVTAKSHMQNLTQCHGVSQGILKSQSSSGTTAGGMAGQRKAVRVIAAVLNLDPGLEATASRPDATTS